MEDRALKTLRIMLKERGGEPEIVSNSLDETKMYTFGKILVIFSLKSRVAERDFEHFVEFASENNFNSGIIIVSPIKPSETVMAVLTAYVAEPSHPFIAMFELRHLQFDISQHRMVPAHKILEPAQKNEFEKKYKPESLPKLWFHDPMARWIGAKPGDIISVNGLCEASGDYQHWRLCVAEI